MFPVVVVFWERRAKSAFFWKRLVFGLLGRTITFRGMMSWIEWGVWQGVGEIGHRYQKEPHAVRVKQRQEESLAGNHPKI